MIDRRAIFFLCAAAVSAALIPVVEYDPKHPMLTKVGPALVVAFVVLAALSWLDHWSRHRERR